jgi:DNA polymerase-1
VKWITQYGGLDALLEHVDEITGVVGQNLRDQQDRAVRNRKLNRLVTDVELEVKPADLKRTIIDEDTIRPIFERLQFRTLLERLAKIAAAERGDDPATATVAHGAESHDVPEVQELTGSALGAWLERATDSGTKALGLRVASMHGDVTGFGLANMTETVWVPWTADGTGTDELVAWLASESPKVLHAAKAQLHLVRGAGLELNGIAFDNDEPSRNHIHTVVRTPNGNDYGKDLLRQHLLRYHAPTASGATT